MKIFLKINIVFLAVRVRKRTPPKFYRQAGGLPLPSLFGVVAM